MLTAPWTTVQPHQVRFMVELGVISERCDEFTAWETWGRIIHDHVVRERHHRRVREFMSQPWKPGEVITRPSVIEEMTPLERGQLRDRILQSKP